MIDCTTQLWHSERNKALAYTKLNCQMKEGTSTDQIEPRHNEQHVQGAVRPSTHTCPASRRPSGPHREKVFAPSSAAGPRTAVRLTSARRPFLERRTPVLNCSRRLHEDFLLLRQFHMNKSQKSRSDCTNSAL